MKSTLALSSAALLALAKADGPYTLGSGADDVSPEAWASVAESANLTSSQTLTGRDVSSEFPGSSADGWTVSLAVRDNLPAEDGDDVLTATTLTLTAAGEESSIDDSWMVCAHVFPVMTSSNPGFAAEVPGCDGLVAAECVDDLAKQGRRKLGEGCPSWKITPSCLRDLSEQKGYGVVIDDDLISGNASFFRQVDGSHAADDESVYMAAALQPYAVVTVFGPSGDSEEDAFAEVTCILPDTVEDDSVHPAPEQLEEEEDAAAGLTKLAGWAALTGAVALQFLF